MSTLSCACLLRIGKRCLFLDDRCTPMTESVEFAPNTLGMESREKGENVPSTIVGDLVFFSGTPLTPAEIERDVICPIFGEYYRGDEPPAGYLNARPSFS